MISDEVRIGRKAKLDFTLNARQYLNPYRSGSREFQAYETGWVEASEYARELRLLKVREGSCKKRL